jgi:DNA-binding response OmpR family regulator
VAGADRARIDAIAADLHALGYHCRHRLLEEPPDGDRDGPRAGWEAALVDLRSHIVEAVAWCQRGRREGWLATIPLVFIVDTAGLGELHLREGLFDDFVEAPWSPAGLDARINLVRWRARRGTADALQARDLVLEPLSYRVALRGVPLELTFMEFELLKFLMSHPHRVFTRETILSRVWGYQYYGGVRTVDVHVRRLRAKLGEDHARLIETVRGVGYRFAGD